MPCGCRATSHSPLLVLSRVHTQARWRRGESVNMVSAREQMLTYEQIARVPVRNI